MRYTENVRSVPTLAQPALCILAQGSKSLFLGDEQYAYDPLHYMVVSVTLPLSAVRLDASPRTQAWACAWTWTRRRSAN